MNWDVPGPRDPGNRCRALPGTPQAHRVAGSFRGGTTTLRVAETEGVARSRGPRRDR